jgi:hypothetical protein
MAVVYPSLVSVIQTDTFEEWRKKTNLMIGHAEAAAANIGNLSFLNTDSASTIVDAINEVDAHADTNALNIGTMSDLNSSIAKADLVQTINAEHLFQNTQTVALILVETQRAMAVEANIQSELDNTQLAIGLDGAGSYLPFSTSSYLTAQTTIAAAIAKLDIEAKRLDDRQRLTAWTLGDENDDGVLELPSGTTYIGNDYIDGLGNGRGKVLHSLVVLDAAIKSNADEIGSNDNTIAAMQQDILALIASAGTNSSGNYIVDADNSYATSAEIRENIKLIDNNLDLLYTATNSTLPSTITSLEGKVDANNNAANALIGNLNSLSSAISASTIVGSLNALYTLLKPLLDGDDSTMFVRRAGDIMSGGLEVRGPISATTSTGNITSVGDISAFV